MVERIPRDLNKLPCDEPRFKLTQIEIENCLNTDNDDEAYKNIANAAQKKLLDWLNAPCNEHLEIKHINCTVCYKQLCKDLK